MLRDLSLSHVLILMVVLVLVFGAKRIPELGASIGNGIREFKRSLRDITDDRPETRPAELPGSTSAPIGGATLPSSDLGREPQKLGASGSLTS